MGCHCEKATLQGRASRQAQLHRNEKETMRRFNDMGTVPMKWKTIYPHLKPPKALRERLVGEPPRRTEPLLCSGKPHLHQTSGC